MLSTSWRNVTNGIENDCIVSAPPSRPIRSANSVSSGVISSAAMIRGVTRKRTGIEPHRRQRVDFLVDLHRADLGGERGARSGRRAGSRSSGGPSSRSIDRPIRSATKISAPKRLIGIADWNARITPSRNEISATIGSASAPTRSQIAPDVLPADRRRVPRRVDQRGRSLADELDLRRGCRATTPAAMTPISSIDGTPRRPADRGRARGRSGSNCCSSTSNAGFRFATCELRRARPAAAGRRTSRRRRRRSSRRRRRRRRRAAPGASAIALPAVGPTRRGSSIASRRPDSASTRRPSAAVGDRERSHRAA